MGLGQEDGGHIECWELGDGQVRWDEIWSVNVEFGEKVEVHVVVDASGVPALEELLVEYAVFAEVLPEAQEDASAVLLKVYLVAAYAIRSVIDCERYHNLLPAISSTGCRP